MVNGKWLPTVISHDTPRSLSHLLESLDSTQGCEYEKIYLDNERSPGGLLVRFDTGAELPDEHTSGKNEKLFVTQPTALERKPSPNNHLGDDHQPQNHE
ncbi:MAG: hypothetical protein NTX96_02995 [Candidatus Zambryskibacteria bacterium]|nr:hypothetical protein [Candidatus Zambryskibacteria bacterium]